MDIEKINNEIKAITNEIRDVENERQILLKMENVDYIKLDVLESILLGLENRLNLETARLNEFTMLQDYQNSCSHVFIEDLIDITPEKSKIVKYCAHCLFTLPSH